MNAVTQAELLRSLPPARRYARALSGSQTAGDALVAAALREGLPPLPARLALYAGVTRLAPAPAPGPGANLSPRSRQLLLLTALEELPVAEAAQVVGVPVDVAETELDAAREALRSAAATDILVIEDEPIIAMDVRQLVEACGHRVVGVAASEAQAVRMAAEMKPRLILADVNLGAGGDGINAVNRIQREVEVPVIFVTAYPERLLTAEQVEPAFVISKPFEPLALAIATYQAVSSTVPIG
ncbi:response regulator [Pseudoroseomonas cervicalis]|uniref:response regulator n=1 Tax=Teichococcus cervicalis TaxID=204525 RepID=UPI00278651F4|nr:response regulator [Pseudoroseomonas cervicalis]MDQ1080862.1 CheY-like chemotaxis protein [Pseudoroseomonas cervicalis]